MVKFVAKKLFTTVPDALADKLQQRANEEGRTVSSLIAYFCERMMEDWQLENHSIQPNQKPK